MLSSFSFTVGIPLDPLGTRVSLQRTENTTRLRITTDRQEVEEVLMKSRDSQRRRQHLLFFLSLFNIVCFCSNVTLSPGTDSTL